jgi:hypothetical protein
VTVEWVCEQWQRIVGVRRVTKLVGSVKVRVESAVKQHPHVTWWNTLFEKVRISPFLTGQTTDFQADLFWVLGPKNSAKVLSDLYAPKAQRQSAHGICYGDRPEIPRTGKVPRFLPVAL